LLPHIRKTMPWSLVVSGMLRMSYVTDVLRAMMVQHGLSAEEYRRIHMEANMRITLCLLKSPFVLRQLMLRPTMDTLPGDDVGDPLAPPDPANMRASARRASARSAGLTASTASAAAHPASAVAAREH